MKHSTKLGLIIAIAVVSAILEFGFGLSLVAQIIITTTGTLIALSMLKEMIKTLRSGSYGVDLLAITAVAATLAVGQAEQINLKFEQLPQNIKDGTDQFLRVKR